MKQLEATRTQTYNWWRNDGEDIQPNHVEALKEEAEHRIASMTPQGFTSGELNSSIRISDEDGDDGVEYRGWWTTN